MERSFTKFHHLQKKKKKASKQGGKLDMSIQTLENM